MRSVECGQSQFDVLRGQVQPVDLWVRGGGGAEGRGKSWRATPCNEYLHYFPPLVISF